MNTVNGILAMVSLLVLCGLGPTLLLFPAGAASCRILLIPVLGFCSGILLTNLLASFGLVGSTISIAALIFFILLAIVGIRKSPLGRSELAGALLPLLICTGALAVAAWPLLRVGCENYWGFANPDHAFYIEALDYTRSRPFEIPGRDQIIIGLSYLFSLLSLLTRIPISQLFSVVAASMVFLVPASVLVLCESTFALERRVALAAACSIACSSLVAYTFYLSALGVLTVMVTLPVGLAFAISYLKQSGWQRAVVASVVGGAMYYCYVPGAALLWVCILGAAAGAALRRELRARRLFVLAGLASTVVLVVFLPYARAILGWLILQSTSKAWTASDNEIQMFFARTLTEEFVPFFWGLKIPTLAPPTLLGPPVHAFIGLFALGCLLFMALCLSPWKRFSGLPESYGWVLASVFALLLSYWSRASGYGVFKLVAWAHPVVLLGFVASALGMAKSLRLRGRPLHSAAPVLLVLLYCGVNLIQAARLGGYSIGLQRGGGMHNAPWLSFESVQQLTEAGKRWGRDGIVVALPDCVAQLWATPFLGRGTFEFFPRIGLLVEDSRPRADRRPLQGRYLLHWAGGQDVTPPARGAEVWQSAVLSLTPVSECRNALFLGKGWYRTEMGSDALFGGGRSFRWLRKRGEAIVLNPPPSPQLLRMTLMAGYGNPSPLRHLVVLLNGQKIDEMCLTGYGRVLSRPFTASAPWSQFEFEVREDAASLPRRWGLWNLWVPEDPRRLNIALAELALVDARRAMDELTSQIELNSPEEIRRAFQSGVYEDGWVGSKAAFQLQMPAQGRIVEIEGELTPELSQSNPFGIRVFLAGSYVGQARIERAGKFLARVPIPEQVRRQVSPAGVVLLTLEPTSTFKGSSPDTRMLAFRPTRVALGRSAPSEAGGLAGSNNH